MGNGGMRCALASLDGVTVSNVSSGFERPALARHKNGKTCPGSSSWIPTPTRSPPPPPVRLRPMGRLAPSLEVSVEDWHLRCLLRCENDAVRLLIRLVSAVVLGVGTIFGRKSEQEVHWSEPPNWIADADADDAESGDP